MSITDHTPSAHEGGLRSGYDDTMPASRHVGSSHRFPTMGAGAIGALAVGALAIGALAVGALAIGRLAVGRARIGRLDIDELRVRRLEVEETLTVPAEAEAG
jgi:hypothetical protein